MSTLCINLFYGRLTRVSTKKVIVNQFQLRWSQMDLSNNKARDESVRAIFHCVEFSQCKLNNAKNKVETHLITSRNLFSTTNVKILI